MALALLLAPFIFIPGVYVVGNLPGRQWLTRLAASFAYVAVSGFVGFFVMSWFSGLALGF